MTTVSTNAPAEVTAADTTARWPLLLILATAIVWLVLAGVLSLIASIQLVQPTFMADCSSLTFGRTIALQESIFVYGWAANAGLGLALWLLSRLGGSPLRAQNWIVCGTLFWNFAIVLGLVGIATGDATSIVFLELPRYVQGLMLVAYACVAMPGVLAWIGRRNEGTFAAQWYAVAAIFLFPWLFSAAQVMLLWSPLRGTVQAVAAGWYVQGAWTLWLAPLGLAAAYYVVPKVTGKALPSYEFAPHAFWCLLLLGAFTGGRHLVGGPVPAWIGSLAIVSCSLLLFHYAVVLLNLRAAFTGRGTSLNFIAFGLAAYVGGGFLDAITSFRSVAGFAQFTYLDAAQQQLALYGGCSMMLFGGIYYAVPRLTGRPWASALLVSGHRALAMLGASLLVVGLAAAGKTQGHDLLDAKVAFSEIASHTRGSLLAVAGAQAILLLGNIVLLVNFGRSAAACWCTSDSSGNSFRQPTAMEASVS